MENTMREFIEILRKNPDKAYDFIANNYLRFSKDELANIAKELLYGIYHEAKWGFIIMDDHNKILAHTAEELAEYYEEEA